MVAEGLPLFGRAGGNIDARANAAVAGDFLADTECGDILRRRVRDARAIGGTDERGDTEKHDCDEKGSEEPAK